MAKRMANEIKTGLFILISLAILTGFTIAIGNFTGIEKTYEINELLIDGSKIDVTGNISSNTRNGQTKIEAGADEGVRRPHEYRISEQAFASLLFLLARHSGHTYQKNSHSRESGCFVFRR